MLLEDTVFEKSQDDPFGRFGFFLRCGAPRNSKAMKEALGRWPFCTGQHLDQEW
jgi:hypothetical protein